MPRGLSHTIIKSCSLLGAHLILANFSFMWIYGNLFAYMNSYFVYSCSPGCTDVSSQWILSFFIFFISFGAFALSPLERKIGTKASGVLSMFLGCAAFFGMAWTVKKSVLGTALLVGLVLSPCAGMTMAVSLFYIYKWAPERASVLTASTTSFPAILAIIQNPIITFFVNPNNLAPDAVLGPRTYFSQPELLSRVPGVLILLAAITLALQGTGYLLIFSPQESEAQAEINGEDHVEPVAANSLHSNAGKTSVSSGPSRVGTLIVTSDKEFYPSVNMLVDSSITRAVLDTGRNTTWTELTLFSSASLNSNYQRMTCEQCDIVQENPHSGKCHNENNCESSKLVDSGVALDKNNYCEETCSYGSTTNTENINTGRASTDISKWWESTDNNKGWTNGDVNSGWTNTDMIIRSTSTDIIKGWASTDFNKGRVSTDINRGTSTELNKSTSTKSITSNESLQDILDEADVPRSFRPSEALKTRAFWCVWLAAAALGHGLAVKSNYYKEFGLIYIPNDEFLTIVGSCIPIASSISRIVFGYLLDSAILDLRDALVLSQVIQVILASFWFFAAQLNKYVYMLTMLGLASSHTFRYLIVPTAARRLFGPEHFAINYALLFTSSMANGVSTAILVQPILNTFGWFWLFTFVAVLSLLALILTVASPFKTLHNE